MPNIGLAAALLDKSRYKNLKAVAYPDRYSVYLRRRQHFPELSGYSAHYGGECYSHPFSGGNFPIALTANFHVHRNFLRWLTKLNQKGYRYLWQPFFIYLLILQQHCNKSLSKTSESGLFTAFLQKSYQVFFLDGFKFFACAAILPQMFTKTCSGGTGVKPLISPYSLPR